MNKPIILTVCIAIACCVGFIGGMYFGGFYHRDIVLKTISEYGEFRKLQTWLSIIVQDESVLKDLESINEIRELELIKKKYRKAGLSHINILQKQVSSMKEDVPNPSALKEYEIIIEKYKKYFDENAP